MSQILKSAARTSIYSTNDGTGRDTYVSFDHGGNTAMYRPNAKHITHGQMRKSQGNFSPTGLIPPKTIHYDQNGTGRDTYIMCTSGGLLNQMSKQGAGPADPYVNSLRYYRHTIQE